MNAKSYRQNTSDEKYTLTQVSIYFVINFVLTWSIMIPSLLYLPENIQTLAFIPVAFSPMIAAIITICMYRGKSEAKKWIIKIFKIKIPISQYFYGIFILPIGIGVLHYLLYLILGGNPEPSSVVPWKYYLLYITLTLLTGGNEEPGWRGFALPCLLEYFNPLMSSLILGLIHSAWHLPLMSHYNTSFGHYVFNLLPLTVIFNWVYLRSKNSIWPVMFFHSGTNIISSFIPTPMTVLGGVGDFVLLRGITYWIIALIIILFTKGSIGHSDCEKIS